MGAWLEDPAEVDAAIARMHADPDYRLEGGESARMCLARFDCALARIAAENEGLCVGVGSHGGILSHHLARFHRDMPDYFWRRIRNPHLFVFDFEDELRWIAEHTLDGSPGVLG